MVLKENLREEDNLSTRDNKCPLFGGFTVLILTQKTNEEANDSVQNY